MDLETQIKLVDDLIAQKRDRTIADFIRVKNELEKYDPTLRRITWNTIREQKPPQYGK